jgi:hypothetical protein
MTDAAGSALTRRALLGGLAASACVTGYPVVASQEERPGNSVTGAHSIEVRGSALPHFQPSRPDLRRFGGLEYRGGLVLSSSSSDFGGWSGLVIDADGRRFLSVSDLGHWLSAGIEYASPNGPPSAVVRARIGDLRGLRGRALVNKAEQDAESVALLDGTLERGTLLIGFERVHRIARCEIRGGEVYPPSESMRLPGDAPRMPANQGLEALTVIRSGPYRGSVVAFAERFTRGSGYHTGWIWAGGRPQRLQLRDIDGFDITDAAGLPDGGLLVLERYFRWTAGVHMRIRRLLPNEIRPGARLPGHVVLEADSSYEIDNMEGIAVHRGGRGETVVTLMSDNNNNRLLQRTVLLQFTLVE